MKITDLKGKRITVFGLGLNGGGVDTVRFLVGAGARVIATDIKTRETLARSLEQLADLKGVTYVLGQHRHEDFAHVDMVIKTPGAPWNSKQVQIAHDHGVPVYVDASLFFLLNKQPVIGVTGSKGKTTTTMMIAHFLRSAKRDVVPVGVHQTPVLGTLHEITKGSVPVFELSSWRLAALDRIKKSPRIAVVTNILTDHADYYKTPAAYEKDKRAITAHQKKGDALILNADDPTLAAWAQKTTADVIWYSTKQIPQGHAFFVKNGIVYERVDGKTIELYPLASAAVEGAHNHANLLAATAAARAAGVAVSVLRSAVATFAGVPHRGELVATVDGVRYVNDTAATIPDAAIASMRACTTPVVLIAGGSDKRLQFDAFARAVLHDAKAAVFLAGTATDKMCAALKKTDPAYTPIVVESMADAVRWARAHATEGDTVLLAPGAASFGMFANEFVRGDAFRAAVRALGS